VAQGVVFGCQRRLCRDATRGFALPSAVCKKDRRRWRHARRSNVCRCGGITVFKILSVFVCRGKNCACMSVEVVYLFILLLCVRCLWCRYDGSLLRVYVNGEMIRDDFFGSQATDRVTRVCLGAFHNHKVGYATGHSNATHCHGLRAAHPHSRFV